MTEKERVLDGLKQTAHAIAETFGSSCETLIHDMQKPGHPVIVIYNGHISGRQVGSTASIFGDDLGEREIDYDTFNAEDAINTLAITNSGRHVKSTTIAFRGKGYHYALGINFDFTALISASNIFNDLTSTEANLGDHVTRQMGTSLESIFEDCVRTIGKPLVKMKKQDKIQLITLLMEHKAFDYQKSVTYVAEQLGLSRYTVYKYIHEVEESL